MIESILNFIFPHEDLPFGRRWRLAGAYVSPKTDASGSILTRGLPWFRDCGLYLHRMDRPDADRDLHCHPYAYGSVILRGGYMEQVKTPTGVVPTWRRPGEFVAAAATRFHRIDYLPEGRAWTLFLAGKPRWMTWQGRQVHSWGFDTPEGYKPWTEYERGSQ